jgi:hypothetical protein
MGLRNEIRLAHFTIDGRRDQDFRILIEVPYQGHLIDLEK